MGDYKLKTANDYVVPDHLRMNVEKARGRLLILKDLVRAVGEICVWTVLVQDMHFLMFHFIGNLTTK